VNQFFNNIATTTWALRHVLFVIDYKVPQCRVKENKESHCLVKNTPQSAEQQLNEKMLHLVSKVANEKFASLNYYTENVDEQSQKYSMKMFI